VTNKELVAKCIDIAKNYKTLYVMGCFGAPLTGGNVTRYCQNHEYNRAADRTRMIKAAANQSPPVFGFDCVCLIKGILWGWNGDASRTYGKFTFSGIKAAGYGNVSRAVMYDGRLSTKAKGLYAYFVSYAGGGNQATPPLKTILYHLGVTETSYHKYLAELTSLNYVIITQKHINGQLSCNDYHIVSKPR